MEANSNTQGKNVIILQYHVLCFSILFVTELKMEHHHKVCVFLKKIDKDGLIELGGALGLNHPKLTRMNSKQLPGEVAAAWLRGEDNVLEKSGKPTWLNLVKALEEIGQRGIAEDIKQKKHLDQNDFNQEENGAPKHRFNKLHFCLLSMLLVIAIVGLVYYFFPTIMYHFHLYHHSKTLPYVPENFAGRENELGEVIKLIDFSSNPNDFRIVNIIGSPGFGKSTLAIHVGHEMVRSGVLVLYVDLTDFPSDQPVKQVLADKILEGAQIFSQFAVKFDRLLRWARESYQNKLLILDNCDEVLRDQRQMDEFQIALQKLVEASRDLKILMTSRREIVVDPYSKFYSISELSLEASCELLQYREQNGIKLTPDQRNQIANLTGNVPLALHIMKSLLDRIGAPRPDEFIKELAEEPIKTLSPEDFQSNKQVKATFNLSYRYLDRELQILGSQLTLFPGSFTEEAAAAIFMITNVSEVGDVDKNIRESLQKIRESLQYLVRNSILSYDYRKGRYQYHQLIKDYLLHIQTEIPEGNSSKYFPSYCIYYSSLLTTALATFQTNFEVSVAIVNSDRHNFHHLLNALKTMQLPAAMDEFLDTAIAISVSFDIGLLNIRFPINDTHMALKNALIQFDFIIDNDLHKECLQGFAFNYVRIIRLISSRTGNDEALASVLAYMQHIIGNEIFLNKERSQSFIFSNYVRIMKLVSGREGNIEASVNVLAQRQNRIEANRDLMDSDVYIDFFQLLDSYHSQLNHTQEANECRSKIFMRTYAHLSTCLREEECTHINVGISHYHLGEYTVAVDLLELALLEKGINFIDKARILTHLISAYSKLKEQEKLLLNINKLRALHRNIMNLKTPEYFWHYKTVSTVFKVYMEQDLVSESGELFEKIVSHLKKGIKSESVHIEVCCEYSDKYTITFLDVHNLLTELYDTEQYIKVVKMATLMIEVMNKFEAAQPSILSHKLKLQLLMGKAKVHNKNYSDGLQDIELVLEMILSNSKGVPYNYEDEKRSACWELFPRVVYLEPCYQIKAAIIQSLVNTALSLFNSPRLKLFVLGVEKSLQDRIRSLTMSSLSSVQNERVELSHAKELASTAGAFKYTVQAVTLLQELRKFLESFALASSIILLKMCVLSLRILFNAFFCFLFDVHAVWFKLTSVYLVYRCIRYRHLIMYFIADYYFCQLVVFESVHECLLAYREFLKQPKDIGIFTISYYLYLLLHYNVHKMIDPRFKYGESHMPHVYLIVDRS
jgi:tetratricopeptide (TPR) repeat protein